MSGYDSVFFKFSCTGVGTDTSGFSIGIRAEKPDGGAPSNLPPLRPLPRPPKSSSTSDQGLSIYGRGTRGAWSRVRGDATASTREAQVVIRRPLLKQIFDCQKNRRPDCEERRKRQTPKGGRRLATHLPSREIPVWWRRAVLPTLLWVVCFISFFLAPRYPVQAAGTSSADAKSGAEPTALTSTRPGPNLV